MRIKLVIFAIICVAIAAFGIIARANQEHKLVESTEKQDVPVVSVIAPKPPADTDEIVLPGYVQAWHDAPIYARTNGYVQNWYTDIGAHVKEGDALADLDTPEVDAQLRQAEADLQTADANNTLAQTTAKRWTTLRKTDSVTQQETDEKTGDADAKAAAAVSAKANRDRLTQLEAFKHITAPFDGVISARNLDKGDLVDAGSGGTGKELFHIVDKSKLRVYIQVPENYTQRLTPGMTADLHFAEHPDKTYKAILSAGAGALNATTRSLQVEWTVDNKDEDLMPGGYTEAHIKVPGQQDGFRLPVNTLLFRTKGVTIATVDGENHARLKIIKIGRDFGSEVEVTAGLAGDDKVMVNPPDSLTDGQSVRIAEAKPAKDGAPPAKAADDAKDDKDKEKHP